MVLIQTLNLYHNKLVALEKSIFNGLTSLTYLAIQINLIETIADGCFSDLRNLNYLYLGTNKLSGISGDMWQGLNALRHLYLHYNNIATLESGDLDYLPKLEVLLLYMNPLTTLSHTIFNPSVYPETNGHPQQIKITLGALWCDDRLCCLKQGERLGWISWFQWTSDGKSHQPDCINHPDLWNDVELNCPKNRMF